MIRKTLYFGNPTYLSTRLEQLVIKLPQVEKSNMNEALKKEAERTIPIEDIGMIILDDKQITLTNALIDKLQNANVAIVSCNSQHMPLGLMLPLSSHTETSERLKQQVEASQPLRKQMWQQTVRQKIVNQSVVLDSHTGQSFECMRVWANEVRSGDADNMEARAAAFYWRNILPKVPGFVRGRDDLPPNDLFNYGYAVVRATVARALVGCGLNPTLGIFHRNKYNAYCLADDIMEPYRPLVDKVVCEIVDSQGPGVGLTHDVKVTLLSLPMSDVRIDGSRRPLMNAVNETAASVQKCFAGEARKILYPDL